MSAKKARPTKASKLVKDGGKTTRQKPATQRAVLDAPPPELCPQGGEHDWTDDECSKCHEPTPKPDLGTTQAPDDSKTTLDHKGVKTKAEAKPQRLSALAAAANVLGEVGEPMTTAQMIEMMETKGYWTSPGGKTPGATLYSAILRQIHTKGKESIFVKTDRGRFGLNTQD